MVKLVDTRVSGTRERCSWGFESSSRHHVLASLILGVCLLTSTLLQAKELVQFKKYNAILNVGSNKAFNLYKITNKTHDVVMLNHVTGHSMSAGWMTEIDASNMTALLVQRANFSLTCTTPAGKTLKCRDYLDITTLTYNTDKTARLGEYWLVENTPAADFTAVLEKRGFSLK